MKVSFATRQLRRGFTLIELLVVIAIIALLASVAYGPILNQINKGDQMQALTNMKNVGVAMNEFKSNSKLGNFPDDITADRVVAQHNYMSGLGALQGIPPMTTSASFWAMSPFPKATSTPKCRLLPAVPPLLPTVKSMTARP